MAAAAEALGMHATGVRDRIRELEYNLGGELINRAHAGRPMTLTQFGQDVLIAYQEMLESPRCVTWAAPTCDAVDDDGRVGSI
ncbi:LysR family transcriptional regulator [Nocardia farcinica]|nr:LysR family transcriptional regulator [Nocardia farcinica]MBF6445509.1 LysR family transcriptional regulator [Nocardia farcinica]MBF6523324.1 LysR family transcriptional regulator [Nocardia farcinica]